jgi:small subunit ribosomal protein S6
MRRYELMLLLRPDLEDDKLQSAVEKVTRAIVNAGGSLTKVSPWGKRRLAYDIKNHREASYFLIHFDIEPSQIREIERGMLITEEILRHLVTVLEDRGPADEIAPAAPARGAQEATDEAAADVAVDEEDDDTSADTSDDSPADEEDAVSAAADAPERPEAPEEPHTVADEDEAAARAEG